MSSLPLYWGEHSGEFAAMLDKTGEPGWVRQTLEARYRLEPLDTLEPITLRPFKRLLLAQPRPLAPAENVALDTWVRDGGQLLLFADPLLTGHSHFPIGDPRRPQDGALLSTILARWGLELLFDDTRDVTPSEVELAGTPLPIEAAGTFRRMAGGGCTIEASGVLARCKIGSGTVVVFADAEIFDAAENQAALATLLSTAFN